LPLFFLFCEGGQEGKEEHTQQAANSIGKGIHNILTATKGNIVALQALYEPTEGHANNKDKCEVAKLPFREAAEPEERKSSKEREVRPFINERDIDLRQVVAGHEA